MKILTALLMGGLSFFAQASEPDPADVTAIRATSWSEARYAFCSLESRDAVLIDFEGSDLSSGKGGTFGIAARPCDGSGVYRWHRSKSYSAAVTNQKRIFEFWNPWGAGDDDYLEADEGDVRNEAFGIFAGNSGVCIFLKNKGTKGIFVSEPATACR